jgi:hypothetical protein
VTSRGDAAEAGEPTLPGALYGSPPAQPEGIRGSPPSRELAPPIAGGRKNAPEPAAPSGEAGSGDEG